MAGPDCCVCLEPLASEENTALPCTHNFHSSCLRTWLRTVPVCPLCRLPVTRDGSAPAPPGSDGDGNPLSLLWQFIAESTLSVLAHRLRHVRVNTSENDPLAVAFSNQDFLMNLSQVIIENLLLASVQNDFLPRQFEARVALRPSPGASTNAEGSANEGGASDEGGAANEGGSAGEGGEPNEGRYYLSFWEVFEETGRVVLVERFGLATRVTSTSEGLQRPPPSAPAMDVPNEGARAREDPIPLLNQRSEDTTPIVTEPETVGSPQSADSQAPPPSTARASVDQSEGSSSASATRRFASKILPRRGRHRPSQERAPDRESANEAVPGSRGFRDFRRWLRDTLPKRSGASRSENTDV